MKFENYLVITASSCSWHLCIEIDIKDPNKSITQSDLLISGVHKISALGWPAGLQLCKKMSVNRACIIFSWFCWALFCFGCMVIIHRGSFRLPWALLLRIDGRVISCELALRWMSLDLTDDKSTFVQVMAWCRQATSHYLSQCWPRSLRHMVSLGPNELTSD